ncbi:gamma-glutamylputrescine synthetase (plasmid) [Haloferax sp. S1W]|uniref:gamma-glutamylputrescine synthetase n=1 Tax=Haloferax sp. S1W TaxID=3377110 RepID=UPI0037C92EC5
MKGHAQVTDDLAESTAQTIENTCSEHDVELIRLLYVGNDGVTRGHTVPARDIETLLQRGVTLPKSVQSLTARDRRLLDGMFDSVGEVRLVPDPFTFQVLPYESQCAAMLCDIETVTGDRWEADPRSALREFLNELRADGFEPKTAFESEFHLFEETESGLVPHDNAGVYSTANMRAAHDVIREMVDALKTQGMRFNRYYPEHAPGKHEIVTGHESGLTAPDSYVHYKETIQGVADGHDLSATFHPKPTDHSTNGCHIHLSLWKDEENAFFDPDVESEYGLSDTARHFIGGVLEHAPALVGLTSPTVNSYARIRPQVEASAYVCWGFDNRESIVRIPSPDTDSGAATRLEFRPADNSANPYLSLLGLLAAGMDGVRNERDPGDPVACDPGNLSADERDARGIERLPTTLRQALDALESDSVLADALGEKLHESYLEVKRNQWRAFTESAGEWKRDEYLRVY